MSRAGDEMLPVPVITRRSEVDIITQRSASFAAMPAATSGCRAFTGGMSIVMMAIGPGVSMRISKASERPPRPRESAR